MPGSAWEALSQWWVLRCFLGDLGGRGSKLNMSCHKEGDRRGASGCLANSSSVNLIVDPAFVTLSPSLLLKTIPQHIAFFQNPMLTITISIIVYIRINFVFVARWTGYSMPCKTKVKLNNLKMTSKDYELTPTKTMRSWLARLQHFCTSSTDGCGGKGATDSKGFS